MDALQETQPIQVPVSMNSGALQKTGRWVVPAGAAVRLAAAAMATWQPGFSSQESRIAESESVANVGSPLPIEQPDTRIPTAESLNEPLAPFRETPEGWRQVGSFQNHHHAIEREQLAIRGDFRLRLELAASRTDQASAVFTLVGAGATDDLKISAHKTNTWSDNEMWYFTTPAGPTTANLPIGEHVLKLDRVGGRVVLSADMVVGRDTDTTDLATFAVDSVARYTAVRIETSGPALKLGRLRINPVIPQ